MNKHKYFFRGVGVALIIAASFFYFVQLNHTESTMSTNHELSDSDIISRAKELGMITEDDVVKEKKDLTDDEVIAKAQKLGMVFEEEIEKIDDKANQETSVVGSEDTQDMTKQQVDTQEEDSQKLHEEKENTEEVTDDSIMDSSNDMETDLDEHETVRLKITYGMASYDVAKLLYDNGIVDNISDFDRYLIINKYDQKIKTGTYVFTLDSTYEEAIKILTHK